MSAVPDRIPDWVLAGEDPPTEPAELWPDQVLSDDEWYRGWFDRKLARGEIQPWERAITPRWLGGEADDPPDALPVMAAALRLLRRYFGDDITIEDTP